jgi:predicted Kef-type K+ transport protein
MQSMVKRVIRFAALCLIALLLLSAMIGIGAAETGLAEKLVLAGLAVALVLGAARVRRLGRPQLS